MNLDMCEHVQVLPCAALRDMSRKDYFDKLGYLFIS